MDIAELIEKLEELAKISKGSSCPEVCHKNADRLLLEFIDDEGITDAFDDIGKLYE